MRTPSPALFALTFFLVPLAAPLAARAQVAQPPPLPPPPPSDLPPTAAPAANSPPSPTPVPAEPPSAAPPEYTPPPGRELVPLPWRHEGFYLRGLSGIGFMSAFGDGPNGSASISGAAMHFGLAIGGSTAPGLAVAVLLAGSSTSSDFSGGPFSQALILPPGNSTATTKASKNAMASLAELGVLVDWYPDPTRGWHAGASIGLGLTGVRTDADGGQWGGAALAGSVFGGYDWWVGRAWSLGLGLVAAGATTTSLNDSHNSGTGYRLTPLSIGIQTSILYY